MSPGTKAKLIRLILPALLVLIPCVALAVPLPLQAAILVKALSYDQTIKAKGNVPTVLVLSGSSDARQAEELAAALVKLNAQAKVVSRSQALETMKNASALYAFPGQLDKEILAQSAQWKVLSLSADVGEVEAGRASMGVGVQDGKPQLVINLRRVTTEGHRLSSRLLKVARVIE